jgi:hypothetical protein
MLRPIVRIAITSAALLGTQYSHGIFNAYPDKPLLINVELPLQSELQRFENADYRV